MERLAANVAKLSASQRKRFAAARHAPTVSEQLRAAIDASGSRYALWKLTGIDQAALSRFMAGEGGFKLDKLDVLCRVLKLELRRLRRVGAAAPAANAARKPARSKKGG